MVPAIAEVDGRAYAAAGSWGEEVRPLYPQKGEGGSLSFLWVPVYYIKREGPNSGSECLVAGSDCFGLQWE